jgi:hypothetical protein
MNKSIKPRKTPQQVRSKQTREDILLATAHLLNRKPLGEVSTNHIAKKTGISNAAVHSMSQLPPQQQQWEFVRVLCHRVLAHLLLQGAH